MNRVAVGLDRGVTHAAVLVRQLARLDRGLGAAAHRLLERLVRVLHVERDVAHAVAVLLRTCSAAAPSGQSGVDSTKRVLFCIERVRREVALPGLETGVRELREAEGLAVVERRLLGVADEELDVMNALQPERIL